MSAALDLAMHYAIDLGWPVLPLASGTKEPATRHGHRDATTDREQIARWWSRGAYGIGVACTRIVVVDIDVRDGRRGRESLAELEREYGAMPSTWIARTPSGGTHYYYAAPADRVVHRACRIREGLDVLGLGGYVVAPPTATGEGTYAWVDDAAGLAPCPEWIAYLRPLDRPRVDVDAPPSAMPRWSDDVADRARRAVAYVAAMPAAVSGEGGHDACWRVALALVRGFRLPVAVASIILDGYSRRCRPPWSERERAHKLACASRASAPDGYLLRGDAS